MSDQERSLEEEIYRLVQEALQRAPSLRNRNDASLLVDLQWQHYLKEIVHEQAITYRQAVGIMHEIACEFHERYDGESDPRRFLGSLMRRWGKSVRSMVPDEGSQEAGAPVDEEERRQLEELWGEAFGDPGEP